MAALDGLRGLAVLSVVLYHAFQLAQPVAATSALHPARWIFGAGRLGVDLFFVLSGFLLIDSWESLRRRPEGALRGFAVFLRRRARRVGPAYWLSLVVLVPLFTPELLRSLHGLRDLALLATFQQYLNPHLPERVNVVYWSLTTEVHFYLLLPILAFTLRRFGRWPTLTACLALSFAWRLGLKGDLPASWIAGRVDEFLAGMIAATMVAEFRVAASRAIRPGRAVRTLTHQRTGLLLGGMTVVMALTYGAASGGGLGRFQLFTQPVVGVLIAALVARAFCLDRIAFFEQPALQFLGAISYSLYLWHRPILVTGSRVLTGVSGQIVLIVVAMAVSWLSYAAIERPFLNRRTRRPEPQPEPVQPEPTQPSGTRTLAPTAAR